MLSKNIKGLRTQKGLTQKELADKLHVTSQAVSRWENGEVEPSVSTIGEMAKIFEVTTDEIIGGPQMKPNQKVVTKIEKEYIVKQGNPVLAVCEECNKPIYNGDEIVRQDVGIGRSRHQKIICQNCDEKQKQENYEENVVYGKSQRNKSFIYGALISVLILIISVILIVKSTPTNKPIFITCSVLVPICTFTFVSCLFLKNNFVGDMFIEIASWGFVKFPGLIFEFSLDGIAWLIAMKIVFWVLGIVIAVSIGILALAVCLPISLFVYPFALGKNIESPELTERL